AIKSDQTANVLLGTESVLPSIAFRIFIVDQSIWDKRLTPETIGLAPAKETRRAIENIAIVFGTLIKNPGIVLMSQGFGHARDAPIVKGVFNCMRSCLS